MHIFNLEAKLVVIGFTFTEESLTINENVTDVDLHNIRVKLKSLQSASTKMHEAATDVIDKRKSFFNWWKSIFSEKRKVLI